MGRGPVDQRVVVAHHAARQPRDRTCSATAVSAGPERGVVVLARVAGHPALRALAGPGGRTRAVGSRQLRLGFLMGVVPGPDDQGPRPGKDAGRVRRTLGVAVGELHPRRQAPLLPVDQGPARLGEDTDPGDTDRGQSGLVAEIDQRRGERGGSQLRCGSSSAGGRGWGHAPWWHDGERPSTSASNPRSCGSSAHPLRMAHARDQAGPLEQADGPGLHGVHDHGVLGLATDDEGDHAVIADRRVAVAAVGAVDGERAGSVWRRARSGRLVPPRGRRAGWRRVARSDLLGLARRPRVPWPQDRRRV